MTSTPPLCVHRIFVRVERTMCVLMQCVTAFPSALVLMTMLFRAIVEQLVEEPWNYIAPLSSVPSADRRRSSHSRAWLRSPFLRQQSHLSGSSSLSVGLLVRKMFFRHAGKMRCGRCMHRCACVCAIRLQCVPSRAFILRNDA